MGWDEAKTWRQGDENGKYYQDLLDDATTKPARDAKRKKIVKPKDMPWEMSRQGLLKHVLNEQMNTRVETVDAYMLLIPPGSKSGKHRHLAEECLYVLAGEGYDLHQDCDVEITDTYHWKPLRNITNLKAWRPIPAGDGQKLSVRFQTYGSGYYSYSFSFTEPWVGGKKPLALSLSYVHSRYTNGLAKDDPLFGFFKIDGLSVGLGSQLKWPDNYFTLYESFNYNKYTTQNYSSIFSFGGGNGTYNALSLSVVLSRNCVDAPIFARSGSEFSITGEVTPPYSLFRGKVDYSTMTTNEKYKWVEFWKFKFKGAWYINLIQKLVLTPRVQFGVLGAYNYDLGITPFQRFYLGGDGLTGYNNMDGRELIGMRGYVNNSLTPGYPNTILGGTVYTKYTLELRYPISLNPSATIYALTFLEAGNDWAMWKEFNPFNVYRSVGVGIRVFLPMFGLLGLDWGYGLDPIPNAPGSNGSQFHFSINSSLD